MTDREALVIPYLCFSLSALASVVVRQDLVEGGGTLLSLKLLTLLFPLFPFPFSFLPPFVYLLDLWELSVSLFVPF